MAGEITLEQLYAGIKKLGDNVLRDMAKENDTKIVYLNQKQLKRGEKSDGSRIGTYLPYTIEKRLSKGLQVRFIDLFYTGQFQNKMFVEARGLEYFIWSKDWKSDMLADRYGDNIFGLQEKSLEEFYPTSQNYLVKKINQFTGWGYA